MSKPFVSMRAGWAGAALLALSFGLSGCGGGGNGPTVSATPSPTAVDTGATNRCDTTYTPNYVSSLDPNNNGDNPVLHWPVFPLRIYFDTRAYFSDTVDYYSPERQDLAIEGFNLWVARTGSNGATYTVVTDRNNANVTVDFYQFKGGAGDTLGTTYYDYDPNTSTIVTTSNKVRISIGITGKANNDLVTAAHEFGHALGINGHSPNRLDLMYFEGNDTTGGSITNPDLNTLLTGYCGTFNKNANTRVAPLSGELKSVVIH